MAKSKKKSGFVRTSKRRSGKKISGRRRRGGGGSRGGFVNTQLLIDGAAIAGGAVVVNYGTNFVLQRVMPNAAANPWIGVAAKVIGGAALAYFGRGSRHIANMGLGGIAAGVTDAVSVLRSRVASAPAPAAARLAGGEYLHGGQFFGLGDGETAQYVTNENGEMIALTV